ncbi:MAG: hypothetical protein Q8R32_00960, partial [bacterium]|nr:hypothetical protein [bacterium]
DIAVPTPDEDDEAESVGDLLDEEIERLVAFEDDLSLPEGPAVAPEVLRVLAEQKIAKAERDLLRAVRTSEERLVGGKILVADTELRAAAEASLVTARQLFAAGNFAEALRLAQEARSIAGRLKSGKIAIQQHALRAVDAEQRVQRILQQLVERGMIGTDAQNAALLRVRQAIEEARRSPAIPPARPLRGEDRLGVYGIGEGEREGRKGNSSGSDSGSDSSGSGSSESGSSGSDSSNGGSSGSGSSRNGSSGSGSSGSGR